MPPRTVSVESFNDIASTFRNGYNVMTRMTVIIITLTTSKIRSDLVALNDACVAIFVPSSYMMLSFVVFFMMPLANSNRMILTTEVNILIAVP
ncbi:hypothetical protein D1872_283860 [compost metagenome]